MLAALVSSLMLAAPADRAAFVLTPGLSAAEHVFVGTVAAKGERVVATVREPLKGPLAKGATLEGTLRSDDEYRAASAPKGVVLVVATKGELQAFGPKTFAFTWAKPTLGLLGGSTSLAPFGLQASSPDKVRLLLDQVFGHAEVPVAVREAVLRELLRRATPTGEVSWMGLPEPLRLPSMTSEFVAYFQRGPRSAFNSAARWVVFTELKSERALSYLADELEAVRLDDDVNSARYVLDAIEASGGVCLLERVRQQRGFWLGREPANRELEDDLTARLGRMAATTCEAVAFRRDLPMPQPAKTTAEQLRAIRALGLFGAGSAEALVSYAKDASDETLVEAAILASERMLERQPVDEAGLDSWGRTAMSQFSTRRDLALRGASNAMARLVRWQPQMLRWLLDHPRARQGPYGRPDDLLEAVVAQLDYRDAAFTERVVRELHRAGKTAVGLHAANAAQPAVVQRVLKELLAAAGAEPTKVVAVLALSARAGLDSLPMVEVAKFLKNANAAVRAAAVEALFSHLVGSEAYARGVPHFEAVLDALADDDATVRAAAVRLIDQLAVKGNYEQYRRACPELATLRAAVAARAKSASGVARERYEAALSQLSSK